MADVAESVWLMDPRGEAQAGEIKISPRLAELDGKVIGLLNNGKPHFDLFMADLGELLANALPSVEVIRRTKLFVPRPVEAETLQELVDKCDAVVTGLGD